MDVYLKVVLESNEVFIYVGFGLYSVNNFSILYSKYKQSSWKCVKKDDFYYVYDFVSVCGKWSSWN